jgi:MerR family transcriptional regulator, copper efflux regulator
LIISFSSPISVLGAPKVSEAVWNRYHLSVHNPISSIAKCAKGQFARDRFVAGVYADMIRIVNDQMRIGELARRARVTPRTVRYYESLGLIPAGEREGAGQHRYPAQTVARLEKIDQLKQLGLSLDEIGSVIHLYFEDTTGKRAKIRVLEMLRRHLADTEAQLASLKRFENWLETNAS